MDITDNELSDTPAIRQSACVTNGGDQSQTNVTEICQSYAAGDRTNQSQLTSGMTFPEIGQSYTSADRTNQSHRSVTLSDKNGQSQQSSMEIDQIEDSTTTDDRLVICLDEDEPTESCPQSGHLLSNIDFKVYCDTFDWRRYVPPLPYDPNRLPGWCMVRDLLMSIPVSVFLNIVSLPVEVSISLFLI